MVQFKLKRLAIY